MLESGLVVSGFLAALENRPPVSVELQAASPAERPSARIVLRTLPDTSTPPHPLGRGGSRPRSNLSSFRAFSWPRSSVYISRETKNRLRRSIIQAKYPGLPDAI